MPKYPILNPIPQFRDAAGALLAAGTVTFYEAGSTTLRAVFANKEGTEQLTNPNTLLSSGQLQNASGVATAAFGSGKYKIVVKDSTETVIYTADGIAIPDISTFGETLMDDTTASAARTTLGLGSGSTTSTGTAAGNVVVLDSNARLPALDARNLTHVLPDGHLNGLVLSNNSSDSAQDIDIAVGSCKDSTGVYDMHLTTALGKQTDAEWTVGGTTTTTLGGRASGVSLSANTWYHVYLIARSDTGVVDAFFHTTDEATLTTAELPSNYDFFRRIGSIKTGSGVTTIVNFIQDGDWFNWVSPWPSQTASTVTTSETLLAIDTPADISTRALVRVDPVSGAGTAASLNVYDPAIDLDAPTASGGGTPLHTALDGIVAEVWVRTDTSSQIAMTADASNFNNVSIVTIGYIDRRGRDD